MRNMKVDLASLNMIAYPFRVLKCQMYRLYEMAILQESRFQTQTCYTYISRKVRCIEFLCSW